MIHIGFTGSSTIITPVQEKMLEREMTEFILEDVFLHHGDCVIGDALADKIGRKLGFDIIIHPPLNPRKRAWCNGRNTTILPEKDYLVRDVDIVKASSVLIACPETKYEVTRSGTWYTYRQARKRCLPIILIEPDGVVSHIDFNDVFRKLHGISC
jgi:hypothetical protein